jgi:hypothetical protein
LHLEENLPGREQFEFLRSGLGAALTAKLRVQGAVMEYVPSFRPAALAAARGLK